MIPNSRRNEIVAILKKHNYCTVEFLAQSVYVSIPTMRRDLTQLEKEGLVKRVHGGASYLSGNTGTMPFEYRNKSMVKEKMRIGEAAAHLIKDLDSVFIDGSSTCLCLAKAIDANLKLKVLTNSIIVAQTLANHHDIQVELTGGIYGQNSLCLYGYEAEQNVSKKYAKYCFISVNAVDVTYGMSLRTQLDIGIKKAFIKNAEKVVLLVDSSKLNHKNYYHVFDFKDIDILITDQPLDEKMMKACQQHQIQVMIAS